MMNRRQVLQLASSCALSPLLSLNPSKRRVARPKLLLIHGRGQQGLNPQTLKAEWLDALKRGVTKTWELCQPTSTWRFRTTATCWIDSYPAHNSVSEIKHPVRDPNTPTSKTAPMEPSPYWGAEPIWDSQTSTHNPMMDEKGRVWFTAQGAPAGKSGFLQAGIEPSVGEGVPAAGGQPPSVDV